MAEAQAKSSESAADKKPAAEHRAQDSGVPMTSMLNPLWSNMATGMALSHAPDIQRDIADEEETDELAAGVQAKLTLGAADDPYEREADQLAARVMAKPLDAPLAGGAVPSVQRKAAAPAANNLSIVHRAVSSPGPGAALTAPLRRRIEPALGADLSAVRIHDSRAANRAAASINARAFTHREHIFLGPGQSGEDLGLMAHEATHTVQQGAVDTVRRNGDADDASPAEETYPPHIALAFSLSGLYLQPRTQATLRDDISERRQYAEMIAATIAGDRYTEELGLGLHNFLDSNGYFIEGPSAEVAEGEAAPVLPAMVSLSVAIQALDWLYLHLRNTPDETAAQVLNIEQSRLDLLVLGVEVDFIWEQLNGPDVAQDMGIAFPDWYDLNFFRHEMAHRRDALMQFREQRLSGGRTDLTIFELGNYALESADVLSFTRIYEPLWGDPAFRQLWNMPQLEDGATPDGPGESQAPNLLYATTFIAFSRSQPGPMRAVIMGEEGEPDPRQVLWDRYLRFIGRTAFTSADVLDQVLTEGYSDRNADPLPSSLSAVPDLTPPFFDLAADTDHAFVMDVSFSDIYETLANAFGGFAYIFEVIRVEGDSLDNVSEAAASGSGEVAGWQQVWGARMARQARYLEADLGTAAEATIPGYDAEESHIAETIFRLQAQMGPAGQGVTQLVALNAALRTIGEVISTFFLMLTTPRHERRLVFPQEGLFVVRAVCTPELDEESEFRRAPSVAWMPVWSRTPGTMARMRAEADVAQMLAQELALAEVSTRLAKKDECDDEYDQLRQEQQALSVSLYGTAEEVLQQQRQQLAARRAELEGGADDSMSEGERRAAVAALDRAISSIDERLETRAVDRNTGDRLDTGERVIASFVSDTGRVTRPLLEAAELDASGGRFRYYVSDLTTEDSGEAEGSGRSRADAIGDALENLFEHYNAYGRGELTAFIPIRRGGSSGVYRHVRVDADFTALGMEAIENITTVISVAAMVAAPFTGGASLAILLPVGIVGSIPAGYRIADRASAGTLRMDMQTAMDLVDIVGSVASAGEAASGSLRLFRTAKFLGVLGTGSDALGIIAVNWQTIEKLQQLPPDMSEGERRLHIMRVLGGALQANGMAIGGQMLARAYSPHTDTSATEPHAEGVHPDSDASHAAPEGAEGGTVTRHDTGEAERPAARPDPEMSALLPADLAGRVPVEVDDSLAASGSNTVHVTYALDSWGLVTDIRIRRAPGATAGDIQLHLSTVRRMQQFVGLSGWIRNLLGRLSATVGIGGRAEAGSLLWEARLELLKLPEVIQARMEQLQTAIDEGRSADAAAIDADIAFLRQQVASHQRTLDDAVRARGRGYVAAESDLARLRDTLRARRGTDDRLRTIPANWSGNLEARWHGLGPPREGFEWAMRITPDGVEVFLQPLHPPLVPIDIMHDPATGLPVRSGGEGYIQMAPGFGPFSARDDQGWAVTRDGRVIELAPGAVPAPARVGDLVVTADGLVRLVAGEGALPEHQRVQTEGGPRRPLDHPRYGERFVEIEAHPQGTPEGDWVRYQHYLEQARPDRPGAQPLMSFAEWQALSAGPMVGPLPPPGTGAPAAVAHLDWNNPNSPAYGHSVNDHGRRRTDAQMRDRLDTTGNPQGRWHDDATIVEAGQMIPPAAPGARHNTEYVINMGRPIGDVFLPDGRVIRDVQMVKVIRGPDGRIVTCYPFI